MEKSKLIFKTEKQLNDSAGIVKKICELTGVSYHDIKSKSNNSNIVTVRQLSIYYVHKECSHFLTKKQIAFLFNCTKLFVRKSIRNVPLTPFAVTQPTYCPYVGESGFPSMP